MSQSNTARKSSEKAYVYVRKHYAGRTSALIGLTVLILIAFLFLGKTLQDLLGIVAAIFFLWFLGSATLTTDDMRKQQQAAVKLLPTHKAMVIIEFLTLGLLSGYFISLLLVTTSGPSHAPIGIVEGTVRGATNRTEWMVNLGGSYQAGSYEGGLQIPLFVVVLGVIGAYVNFLYRMPDLINLEETIYHAMIDEEKKTAEIRPSTYDEMEIVVRSRKQGEAISVLAQFFLAPLLSIGVYLLLIQAGTTDPPAIGVASLGVGLAINQIVQIFEKVAAGIVSPAGPTQRKS